jgi:hypothetical protein
MLFRQCRCPELHQASGLELSTAPTPIMPHDWLTGSLDACKAAALADVALAPRR